MRGARRLLLAALVPLAALAVPLAGGEGVDLAEAEESAPARVVNLRVAGGSGWHPDNSFRLDWDFEPLAADSVASVHYRVRYPDGREAVAERSIPRASRVEGIHLPSPGTFVAEAWAVSGKGVASAPAIVTLMLDSAAPGFTQPLVPGGWVAGGEAAHLRLSRPVGAEPPSGLRGYAIAIDADPSGSPCQAADRCSEAETDLRGGAGDDSTVLTGLPEGRLFVHAVAVSGSGMRSQQVGTAPIRVDATAPTVSLAGVPAGWADGPVRLSASASDALSGMEAAGPTGPFTAIAVDGGAPAATPGGSASALVSGDGAHLVEVRARDAAGNSNPHSGAAAFTRTVRIDSQPPRISFAKGPEPAASERIEARIEDDVSGPAERGTIAVRPARSRQPFAPLPTTAIDGRLVARWDPDAHRAGTYEFQATGYDRAGNGAATTRRADGTQMVLTGGEKTRTTLSAGFGRRLAPTLEVPCGQATAVRGRLTTANASPLAGEEVSVAELPAAAAGPQLTRSIRTAADGSFEIGLAPGPSRRLELSFPGSRGRLPSAARALQLDSRACVFLHASTAKARIGGRPVVFSGRVGLPGRVAPPGGVPVALQFRLPGSSWSEFRTLATDRRGRFRYPYAFADDDSRGVRFQFRAVVAAHAGWPYATGTSRAIAVTGR